MSDKRRHLPLLTQHSNRSALTCTYKCGNACDHDVPNTSDNEYFGDVLQTAFSRRGLLRAGAVVGAAATVGGSVVAPAELAAADPRRRPRGGVPGLAFDAVAPNTADRVSIPRGYTQRVMMKWGDPLFRNTPAFDIDNQTGEKQTRQFGYNCDFLALFPYSRDVQLMTVNHEYTNEELMFPGYDKANPTRRQVEVAWAAHGLSVVAVREDRRGGGLTPIVGHRLNRRFHTHTAFKVTGPAAGHPLLRTSDDPSGTRVLATLNNCSGGTTPWGTWLTGEENFNQYFANAAEITDPETAARLKRYGVSGTTTTRQWEKYEDRWDLSKEPHEVNRFGWICEIDPYRPNSTPRKRTALGRFKHEAAQPRLTPDGRVAVYMGDDERFDYLYKFVSDKKMARGHSWRARRHNDTLLDSGTLYVAKFAGDSPGEIDGSGRLPRGGEFDGTGRWLPLVHGDHSYVDGMSAAEVLIFTRLAADKAGATKMDRPEDVEPHPTTGKVYVALTNNTARTAAQADEPNPRANNKHGQVLELTETGNDAAAETFDWNLVLVCGDPDDPNTYFGGYDKSQVSPISCPDNVTFDPYGNLWISTDGNALGYNDGLFGVALEGRRRGMTRQFLTVPPGAETCGPWVTRERVVVCVQHPGEDDGSTATNPTSHWPDGPGHAPRPSVVAVWPRGGGRVGV